MSELPRSAFRFDPELVRAFVQDRLDDAGRAALADEVARLLPFHRQLPHPVIADLVAVTGHLGGDEALLRWLDGYAGRPRVTARLFRVINLLDRWSAVPGVVLALEQRRARDPYPHALARYLTPDTTAGTLASLGQLIESRLADDRLDEAGCLPCGRSRCSRTSPPGGGARPASGGAGASGAGSAGCGRSGGGPRRARRRLTRNGPAPIIDAGPFDVR